METAKRMIPNGSENDRYSRVFGVHWSLARFGHVSLEHLRQSIESVREFIKNKYVAVYYKDEII